MTTPAKTSSKTAVRISIALIVAVAVLPIWFIFIAPQLRHDRLMKNGVRAQGRLLNVEETGTIVNDSPELELTVEYRKADGGLDTTTTDFIPTLRTLHMYQPGMQIVAAYDPEDPEELTIVELSSAPTGFVQQASNAGADSLARIADSLRLEIERLRQK